MLRCQLLAELDKILDPRAFDDVALNGLQYEGGEECLRIATAATASVRAIEGAIAADADVLLVHHGLFWGGHPAPIAGVLKGRLERLFESDLNLIAYHLPLDAHPELGNNRCLCDMLGIYRPRYVVPGDKTSIAMRGELGTPRSIADLARVLSRELDAPVRIIGTDDPDYVIHEAVICSGSGSFILDECTAPDFELLVTGDVNEQTYHMARETGTVVMAVGHDASEECGVRSLGEHLARNLGLYHVHLHDPIEREGLFHDHRGR